MAHSCMYAQHVLCGAHTKGAHTCITICKYSYCIIMKYVQRIRQHIYHSGLAVLILYFNFFIPCLAVLVWIHVIMWWKVKNSTLTTRACMEGVVWVYPTAVTKEGIRRHRTKTKGWRSKVSRRCGLPIEGQD